MKVGSWRVVRAKIDKPASKGGTVLHVWRNRSWRDAGVMPSSLAPRTHHALLLSCELDPPISSPCVLASHAQG